MNAALLKNLTVRLGGKYASLQNTYIESLTSSHEISKLHDFIFFKKEDDFDSKMLGVSAEKIVEILDSDEYIGTYKNGFTREGKYCSARIPQSRSEAIQALEMLGFSYKDTTIDMIATATDSVGSEENCRLYEDDDKKTVVECAQSFCHGRYFTDPKIKNGTEIYKKWIENILDERDENRVFVHTNDGNADAFVAVAEKKIDWFRYWDVVLIAKHPDSNSKGVAQSLLCSVRAEAKRQDIDSVFISTHGSNIPALYSYERAGFSVANTSVTLAYWEN